MEGALAMISILSSEEAFFLYQVFSLDHQTPPEKRRSPQYLFLPDGYAGFFARLSSGLISLLCMFCFFLFITRFYSPYIIYRKKDNR
jgi:hypothetical protein